MPGTSASASAGTKRKKGKGNDDENNNSNNSNNSNNNSNNSKKPKVTNPVLAGFQKLSLEDIKNKLDALIARVPDAPADRFGTVPADAPPELSNAPAAAACATASLESPTPDDDADHIRPPWTKATFDASRVKAWALELQAVLEEFNLLVACVATATYKWGSDRSGIGDQNLQLLSGELQTSQDQLSSIVTPRLSNVLAPVVDLVVDRVEETKDGDKTIKQSHFARKLVDPSFFRLCHIILARNSPMLRHVVIANFAKNLDCIKDYLEAQRSDSQTDRGFAY